MTDSTKFEKRYITNLEDFRNDDNVYYVKKTETKYKIKIPTGLKSFLMLPKRSKSTPHHPKLSQNGSKSIKATI